MYECSMRRSARTQLQRFMCMINLYLPACLSACGADNMVEPWTLSSSNEPPTNGGFRDRLSAPVTPTLRAKQLMGALSCSACHTAHYEEWRTSPHSHAMTDPIFQGLLELQREQTSSTDSDAFCVQCHSPLGLRTGEVQPGFAFDELSALASEAVSCEVCHRATDVQRPFNAGLVIEHDGYLRGPIAEPEAPHGARGSALFTDSLLCASCHDVRSVDGLQLESPYVEWLRSPAAGEGVTCQMCHMQSYSGRAAPPFDSPLRDELHRHTFVATLPLASEAPQCSERGQLCSAASVRATLVAASSTEWKLDVEVENRVSGHNFPTGSAFFREVWLAVDVWRGDELIFSSGALDAEGLLSDPRNADVRNADPSLVIFHDVLRDEAGRPTLFPWRAVSRESYALEPLDTRHVVYRGSHEGGDALRAEVRLRYRKFSPRLLREIGKAEQEAALQVYDVQHTMIRMAPKPE